MSAVTLINRAVRAEEVTVGGRTSYRPAESLTHRTPVNGHEGGIGTQGGAMKRTMRTRGTSLAITGASFSLGVGANVSPSRGLSAIG
jgi:hypothetical protein